MNIKKKLYFTIHNIHGMGGTERVVINLCHLLKEYFDITIISYLGSEENYIMTIPNETKIIYLDYKFKKQILSKLKFNLLINSLIDKNSIIIANCNHFFPFIKKQHTLYLRLEHYNFEFLNRKYLKKIPISPRVRLFHTLIILSNKQKNLFSKLNCNIKVIPNFLPDIPNKITNYSSKVVISIGRMDNGDQKGFLRLIDIWKLVMKDNLLNEWKLHIIGSGILKDKIESKIKDLNLEDSIIIKPFIKDINKEYLQSSIYVMSSYFEGFPMVLLESAACGLPAIAFDIATGPSDIIEDEISGYLIKDNDLESFSNKLKILMKDENLRKELGSNAKQRVKKHFSKEAILPIWEGLLINEH